MNAGGWSVGRRLSGECERSSSEGRETCLVLRKPARERLEVVRPGSHLFTDLIQDVDEG